MPLLDTLGRPLKDLRISVTDRCNFRCNYCMPLDEYEWVERSGILRFEEIARLARIFVAEGVERIRLTGGEPLVRKDLADLVHQLVAIDGLTELSLTTNGALLTPAMARGLKDAGLHRINISLDTLSPERFARLTQRGELGRVLAGIDNALEFGLTPVKLNAVVMRGVNDDEIVDLYDFARKRGLVLRFIEYMDVGTANQWSLERTVPAAEILERLADRGSARELGRLEGRAPAVDYRIDEGEGLGVIASVSKPFCGSCSRARLTADGKLVTCLFASAGFDLREPMRAGASDSSLREAIVAVWNARGDRYSEERLEAMVSGKELRPQDRDRLEMIRLGG